MKTNFWLLKKRMQARHCWWWCGCVMNVGTSVSPDCRWQRLQIVRHSSNAFGWRILIFSPSEVIYLAVGHSSQVLDCTTFLPSSSVFCLLLCARWDIVYLLCSFVSARAFVSCKKWLKERAKVWNLAIKNDIFHHQKVVVGGFGNTVSLQNCRCSRLSVSVWMACLMCLRFVYTDWSQ